LTHDLTTMEEHPEYRIEIHAEPSYIAEQSEPEAGRYVFAYTITIHNRGNIGAQLLRRQWTITDAHGGVQEVRGVGVVGEQPHLAPGEEYHYTSGAVIETSVGSMEGSYQFVADDGTEFEAPIPAFTLSAPHALH
jgi:ApaG protein